MSLTVGQADEQTHKRWVTVHHI